MALPILSLMGIDVWTLRPDSNSDTNETAQSISAQPLHSSGQSMGIASLDLLRQQLDQGVSVKQQSKPRPDGVVDAGVQDEFLFLFIDYAKHSVVISLPFGSASLPSEQRFFVDDISRALTGATEAFYQASDMQIRDMRWPMLIASHIHHSEEDALALVLQKVKPCKHLLIAFGDLPKKYLSAIESKISEKQLIYTAAIERYFKTPALKRQLWEQLKPFVAHPNVHRKT